MFQFYENLHPRPIHFAKEPLLPPATLPSSTSSSSMCVLSLSLPTYPPIYLFIYLFISLFSPFSPPASLFVHTLPPQAGSSASKSFSSRARDLSAGAHSPNHHIHPFSAVLRAPHRGTCSYPHPIPIADLWVSSSHTAPLTRRRARAFTY